jgi:hypothetical protein
MRTRLASLIGAVAAALDLETAVGVAGLLLLFGGLAMYDVALAMTVEGALLLAGAVAAVWVKRRFA